MNNLSDNQCRKWQSGDIKMSTGVFINGSMYNSDHFQPGTDVMIFKNIFAEKITFLTQTKAKLCEILITTLVFEKNANFFAENCRKSEKIVIITSTPG
jgi:hypothetical protein